MSIVDPWGITGQYIFHQFTASHLTATIGQDDTGAQIFILWLHGGETQQLTRLAQSPSGLSWSPDGKWLAFNTLVPGFNHVFIISTAGGATRQLTAGDYNNFGSIAWSADSETVYFSGNRSDNWEIEVQNSDIFSMPVAGGGEPIDLLTDIDRSIGDFYTPAELAIGRGTSTPTRATALNNNLLSHRQLA